MNKKEQNQNKKEGEPKLTTKARQDIFLIAMVDNQFNISNACLASGISRGRYYAWKKQKKFAARLHEVFEQRGDMLEEAIFENATVAKDTIAQIFLCKTILRKRGYYEGVPVQMVETPGEKAVELLASLIEGESDLRTVALEFTKEGIPLPDAIKIMLSKEPVEEEDDDETAGMLSEEELEERGRAAMVEHNRQVETFIPERRADIEEIKEELKDQDSFSEENVNPEGEL